MCKDKFLRNQNRWSDLEKSVEVRDEREAEGEKDT